MVPRMHRPLTEGARKKTKRDLKSGKQMKLMKMRGASVLAEMRRELAPLRRESPGAAQARPEEGQMPTAPQESACSPDPPPSLPGAGVVRVGLPWLPCCEHSSAGRAPGAHVEMSGKQVAGAADGGAEHSALRLWLCSLASRGLWAPRGACLGPNQQFVS